MATSYLDQFLASLNAAGQGFASGAQGLDKVAQINARDDLIAQAESLDPTYGPLLASSARAGDMGPLQDFLKQRMKPSSGIPSGLDPSRLQSLFPGLGPEQIQSLQGLGTDDQRQLAAASLSAKRQGQETSIKYQDAERREKAPARQQRQKFVDSFGKVEKDLKEKDQQYKNVRDALAKGTVPADAIVFNFLARNVAGEKGPLSDSDISRFASRAFAGDIQKAQNFLSGATTSALSPGQQQAFAELVEQATANYETFKDEVIANQLTNSLSDFDALNTEGKLDKAIETRAKRYGFKAETAEDGTIRLVKDKPQQRAKVTPEEADLSKAVERIQDPAIKAQAMEALNAAAKQGKKIPKQLADMILKAGG